MNGENKDKNRRRKKDKPSEPTTGNIWDLINKLSKRKGKRKKDDPSIPPYEKRRVRRDVLIHKNIKLKSVLNEIDKLMSNAENLPEETRKELEAIRDRIIRLNVRFVKQEKLLYKKGAALERISNFKLNNIANDPFSLVANVLQKIYVAKERKELEKLAKEKRDFERQFSEEVEILVKRYREIFRALYKQQGAPQQQQIKLPPNILASPRIPDPFSVPEEKEKPPKTSSTTIAPKPPSLPAPPVEIPKRISAEEKMRELMEKRKQPPPSPPQQEGGAEQQQQQQQKPQETIVPKKPERVYSEEEANIFFEKQKEHLEQQSQVSENLQKFTESLKDFLEKPKTEPSAPTPEEKKIEEQAPASLEKISQQPKTAKTVSDFQKKIMLLVSGIDKKIEEISKTQTKYFEIFDKKFNKLIELAGKIEQSIKTYIEDERRRYRENLERMDETEFQGGRSKEKFPSVVLPSDISGGGSSGGTVAGEGKGSSGGAVTGAIGGAGAGWFLGKKFPKFKLPKIFSRAPVVKGVEEGIEKAVPVVAEKGAEQAPGALGKLGGSVLDKLKLDKVLPVAGKVLKIGGPVLAGAGTAFGAYQEKDPLGRIIMRSLGSVAGTIAGGFAGGALGSLAGGIGAVPGAVAGGIGGSIAGESLGAKLYDKLFGIEKEKEKQKQVLPEEKYPTKQVKIPSNAVDALGVFKQVLGEKLGVEAAKVATTEGGFSQKAGFLTASINPQSLAAGAFQFLPSVALELAEKTDTVKEKFSDLLERKRRGESLSNTDFRKAVAERVAQLSLEEQLQMYKNYITPLLKSVGEQKIDASMLKSFGFAPAMFSKTGTDSVVYKQGSAAVAQNPYLDRDKSGDITKEEIVEYSKKVVARGENIVNQILAKEPQLSTPLLNERGIELARNSTQQQMLRENEQTQIVAVNNTYNQMQTGTNQSSQLLTGTTVPARNPDPVYQKSLEKTWVG